MIISLIPIKLMNNLLNKEQLMESMNLLCKENEPFLFVVDYKKEKGVALKISELDDSILCSINGVEINESYSLKKENIRTKCEEFTIIPISFEDYKVSFDRAVGEIKNGNSYLLNLTFPTEISGNIDLEVIYAHSNAHYKMLFNDEFVFYSPESFIKIINNKIYSFPMKGTIDGSLDNAENELLNNQKERYEHNTIVDLIRNDLAMVSRDVKVENFRYTERIKTSIGEIIQTSSRISGVLNEGWKSEFGDILFTLLPAGSISGAPKQKTLEIIEECEITERGFYCGVMGVFDGVNVDSCVIIRYIEKRADGSFHYKSGGGITALSNTRDEYDELIKKIYVPII